MKPQRSANFPESFSYASEGLLVVMRTQRNFRIHMSVAFAVIVLGSLLELSFQDWAILMLTIGLVLVSEIVNTAAESLVDLASPEYHPLAKRVKDLAAGAVLVAAVIAVIVGLLILGPPLLTHFGLA